MQVWWRDDAITWRAQGWSIELRGDELAEIRHDGRMILRAVRAAVRDHGWLTVPVVVEARSLDETSLQLRLRHEGLGAHLTSTLTASVDGGVLHIAWDAQNDVLFDTNRTGLVALHPASDAGAPVTVVHDDGTTELTAFPRDVRPHQPILGIRELRIGDEGARTVLRFEGDIFEMEDQRNWTDASFKTYSRPLGLPFPYTLASGERMHQSITIHATDGAKSSGSATSTVIELTETGPFPAVGVEVSTAPDPVPTSQAGSFRVVELDLRTPTWRAALARAAADGRPLDVRIVADADDETIPDAVRALADHEVQHLCMFDTTEHITDTRTIAALHVALIGADLSLSILAGSRSHFTELNREQHRIPRDVDGIAVNTTPLFHSLDTEQLVEALAMQRLTAVQTVRIADGLPVHIGPVSLRPRFNNVATTPEPAPTRADLSEGFGAAFTGIVDDRQQSSELAAWVIGSAAALAVPGVSSLSWFETWGPRGLADASGATPAAAALEALVSLAGGMLLTGDSPDGLVWACGARTAEGVIILAANLDRSARRFTVRLPGGETETIALDAGAWVGVTAAI